MSKVKIDELRALPDYAQLTKWDMSFAVFPAVGILSSFVSDDLNLRCESVELPKPANQKMEINTKGHKLFQNGLNDLGHSVTLTFNETVDNRIFNFVNAWRNITRDFRTGKQFSKNDVEAVVIFTQYDNENNARAAWTLYGVLWESDDFGSLDSASSDIQRPSLTLSFDYFIPKSLV